MSQRQWGHGFHTGQREMHEFYRFINSWSVEKREEYWRSELLGCVRIDEFVFGNLPADSDMGEVKSIVADLRSGQWKGLNITAEDAISMASPTTIAGLRDWFCS